MDLACALRRGWLAGFQQRAAHVGSWHFGTKELRVSGRFGFLEFACDSTPPTTMNNELTIDKVSKSIASHQ